MNRLYYGDNLDVLRRYIPNESVDLVYLDPPFKSNQDYNVLFSERDGTQAAAQLHAFEDTWTWDQGAAAAYHEAVEAGGSVAKALASLRGFLGTSDMMAYLAMMAPRLVELRRVLKPTGALYLHCDPTASHYLKMILDAVFGYENFVNEIVWQRTNSHNMKTKGFTRVNDVLLVYGKTKDYTFNEQYTAYGPEQMKRFKQDKDGRLYKAENLTFSTPNPSRQFEWRGTKPPANRSWGYGPEKLEELWNEGRILAKRDGKPRLDGLKIYLEETKGKPVSSNWTDIPRVSNTSGERLGYPTQKPEALLDRIIQASTNEGAVVLDPFCGCGTTIASAHRLKRQWIGIDITQAAVVVIKKRFRDRFGIDLPCEIVGEPRSVADAQHLADSDPYQFQWWSLDFVGARPIDQRKGADKGIDGRRYIPDAVTGGTDQIVVSVKAGHVNVSHVRDLRGVVERERATQGILISMEDPTRPMLTEAAAAGFVHTTWGKMPRLQIVTIKELMEGTSKIRVPPLRQVDSTYKRAPKVPAKVAEQPGLYDVQPRMAKATLGKKPLAGGRST